MDFRQRVALGSFPLVKKQVADCANARFGGYQDSALIIDERIKRCKFVRNSEVC